MAYYTGPKGNSVASNTVKKNNVNPGYGTQSAYDQLHAGRNNTMDKSRSQGVTYGGSGANASTGYRDGSSGGSSGGGSSSSGGGGSSASVTPYVAQEAPAYSGSWNANELINDYMKYLNARAESAYNRNLEVLNDLYDDAAGRLRSNYNDSKTVLDTNKQNNTNAITADAEEAMRQAYINNMLSRKSLQQAMVAQGLNGGATETTRANMENNYGEARNAIDTTKNKNLAELLAQYQNNLAGLRQQLNSGLTDLDTQRMNYAMQMQSQLQNTLDSYADKLTDYMTDYQDWYNNDAMYATPEERMSRTMGLMNFEKGIQNWGDNIDKYNLNGATNMGSGVQAYLNNLQNIASGSKNFDIDPAQVTNSYDPVSMQQAGIQAAASNYQKALAAQEALGATSTQARNSALSQYGNISSLQEILRQLGYM